MSAIPIAIPALGTGVSTRARRRNLGRILRALGVPFATASKLARRAARTGARCERTLAANAMEPWAPLATALATAGVTVRLHYTRVGYEYHPSIEALQGPRGEVAL